MPSEARRLHGFTVVSGALKLARQLLLPAVVGGASAGGGVESTVRWIALLLAVPSILISFARWVAFRFRIEGDDLILDSGVLARRRRVIPLARVQNIELEQSPWDRLARVAELRLETASGGAETEARLSVLALPEAQALQAELLARRNRARGGAGGGEGAEESGEPGAAAAAAAPEVILRLGTADLAIAGATSNEAGLIAAGLATLLEFAGDAMIGDRIFGAIGDAVGRGAELGMLGAALGIAALSFFLVVAGWLVSIVATIVRFHGFTLSRAGDDLLREYGLLSRHRSTIPLERVQAVRIEESLLRRPLGLSALKVETAGAAPGGSDQPGGRAEAFVPLARRRDVGRLLATVFADVRFDGVVLNPVAPASRTRSFRRLAAVVVLAALGVTLWVDRLGAALLLLLGPAWLWARAEYRARAWARAGGYALARGGVLTRATWVVPERKIQTLHLGESPFQRRHGLGTVMIDTAAGGRIARVVDVHRETGLDLVAGLGRAAAGQ